MTIHRQRSSLSKGGRDGRAFGAERGRLGQNEDNSELPYAVNDCRCQREGGTVVLRFKLTIGAERGRSGRNEDDGELPYTVNSPRYQKEGGMVVLRSRKEVDGKLIYEATDLKVGLFDNPRAL